MTARQRRTSSSVRAVPTPAPADTMAAAVRETLAGLESKLQPEDAALRALAVELAETMDRADEIRQAAEAVPYDPDTAAMVAKLRQRVEAHAVAVEVGPRLLAVLDALGATPKARAAARVTGKAGRQSQLDKLRAGTAS